MKKIIIIISLLFPLSGFSGIYTNTNFKPYIGINGGINFTEYSIDTKLNDTYYSAAINTGARIGKNFGTELFFSHSSTNNLENINDLTSINHEIYYITFGFDIYGYYGISREFDFFTTFGVANYKIYYKNTTISPYEENSSQLSDNNISTRFGIGIAYTFPGSLISGILRFNYTPLGNKFIHNMSEFNLGMRYTF